MEPPDLYPPEPLHPSCWGATRPVRSDSFSQCSKESNRPASLVLWARAGPKDPKKRNPGTPPTRETAGFQQHTSQPQSHPPTQLPEDEPFAMKDPHEPTHRTLVHSSQDPAVVISQSHLDAHSSPPLAARDWPSEGSSGKVRNQDAIAFLFKTMMLTA